ncbi:porin family protein [Pedobacter mendelii]|uniref:Outer membrane protein beta-barrel domain-containing protein n=1 Tax=Pedobacter mendelii TaxID=1908240 RepID=A0ABQ2BIY4_9SPHI|nr:porin family protein [Pedobacter mendelii]GGI27229.1 hypothetical protein GCM10008119_26610 [Pedobacter mendelii]
MFRFDAHSFLSFSNAGKRSLIKPLFVIIIFLVLTLALQLANAQTRIGIKAGVNLSTLSISNTGAGNEDTNYLLGAQFGLTLNKPVFDHWSLQLGLIYREMGFSSERGANGFNARGFKVRADYFSLPFHLLYHVNFRSAKFFIGLGPYVVYGVGGRWRSDDPVAIGDIIVGKTGSVGFTNDSSEGIFESYTYGRPLDYGLTSLVGLEIKERLSLQFNGDFGMANLMPRFANYQPQGKLKNSSFGLALGFKF